MNETKRVDPIPEEFTTYEEAGQFWDTHDTTDYLEDFETVEANVELRQRHYEVEVDEDVMQLLRERAKTLGVAVNHLASDMLRESLSSAA